ncbi:MAG: PKD domain-containing protein [Solirubrobacteraceae bacterium]
MKVIDRPPTASFTAPATVSTGQVASFNASASADPDGTIANYRWDFGDGQTGWIHPVDATRWCFVLSDRRSDGEESGSEAHSVVDAGGARGGRRSVQGGRAGGGGDGRVRVGADIGVSDPG